ncbi:methylenetetrahydrofolate reductase [NAD(P)H] [Terrihabitans rhizophilus]|uniref:Methylenetetrahydrofolate reductase n=1 Tax=Terrihabitans rhizophilus TaxID=3092662 RepID=A0ABU4RM25_9HYPH|nr:methylenetetrahydrofolate reductase [NAD(P)H] [Terrihabitans sp. PJ23]MDX6805646.1 methylenetetrahydrofolate reductase [NAD(P)H] [Terrihabitans sp. PJ23]
MTLSSSAERPSRCADAGKLEVSFEFFPPKSPESEVALWTSISRLLPLCPSFVSVTYGAGGTTRERTHQTVARLVRETDVPPAAHLTCVSATREEIDDVARAYWAEGVRHIVALRGDPPAGIGTHYEPHPGGYAYAADLVAGLKKVADFEISVAAYPEGHPENGSVDTDIEVLKRKVDAGATRAITQFFFDNDIYERYVERVRRAGINVPVVPGIAPVHSFKAIAGFAEKAGASVPSWLAQRFEGLENDAATRQLVAAAVAAEQVLDLVDRGVTDFHFYTMNRADLVYAACHMLGLRPKTDEAA